MKHCSLCFWRCFVMGEKLTLSSVVWREDDIYVSWCPELDIASQGKPSKKPWTTLKRLLSFTLKMKRPNFHSKSPGSYSQPWVPKPIQKLPPTSGRQVVKALSKAGFEIVGRKRSHVRLKKKTPNKTYIVIVTPASRNKKGYSQINNKTIRIISRRIPKVTKTMKNGKIYAVFY